MRIDTINNQHTNRKMRTITSKRKQENVLLLNRLSFPSTMSTKHSLFFLYNLHKKYKVIRDGHFCDPQCPVTLG